MEIIEALKEMKDKIYKIGKAPVLFIGSGLIKTILLIHQIGNIIRNGGR